MINIVENPSNPSHLEWEKNKNRKKIQPIKSWKILFLCHNKTCILVLKKKKKIAITMDVYHHAYLVTHLKSLI